MKPVPHVVCDNMPNALLFGFGAACAFLFVLAIVGAVCYARWKYLSGELQ